MNLRCNLEAGATEGSTWKEAYGKPVIVQDADAKVPSVIEVGQERQDEESGGGIESLVANYELQKTWSKI